MIRPPHAISGALLAALALAACSEQPRYRLADDHDTRRAAIIKMANMGDAKSISVLEHALAVDPDRSIRDLAASSLGDLKSVRSVAALMKAGLEDPELRVQITAVWSLKDLPSTPEVVEALGTIWDRWECPAPDQRGDAEDLRASLAADGLKKAGPLALAQVRRSLSHRCEWIRFWAIDTAGAIPALLNDLERVRAHDPPMADYADQVIQKLQAKASTVRQWDADSQP